MLCQLDGIGGMSQQGCQLPLTYNVSETFDTPRTT